MKPIEDIFPLLYQAKKIVIVPHQKPDADAMGASLALSNFLKQFGMTPSDYLTSKQAKNLPPQPNE